jgi:hypothetical protein
MKKSPTGTALTALKFSDDALSPEQQRFNKLLTKTETLARKIETLRTLIETHRPVFSNTLRPLEQERDAQTRNMVLWLDERLKRKGLTARQRRSATEILCSLAASMAMMGDETMQQLHDAHSQETLAEQEKAETARMQQFMEGMLGKKIGDGQEFDSFQDMLQASKEQLDQQDEAHAQAQATRQSRRKKTPAQQQADALAQDADGALRTIYRQLVSALHPDRESDPAERDRKTAIMKEVNAAYERRDLMVLLQLQLRAALADGEKVANMAREKVAALTLLLKERAAVLTQELRTLERQAMDEFNLGTAASLTANQLNRQLISEQQDLLFMIVMMKQDRDRVQDDAEFKRWLREQTSSAPARNQFDPFGFDPFF